jgi:hypothetical protein
MILLAATVLIVKAQPFSQGLFGAGKILSLSCDTAGVSEGPAGANVTWTIPLTVRDTINSDAQAVPAAGTRYFSKFPSATDALLSQGTLTEYTYYRIANDSLMLLGFADSLQTVVYFNPELMDLRTLAFGNSFTDVFGYRDTTPALNTALVSKIDGTRTVTFDGTGKLVLPWKTFSQALRFKSVTTQTDSTWLGTVLTSAYTMTTTNFSWEDTTLPKNTSFSISRIATTVGGISVVNSVVTFLEPAPSAVIRTIGNGAGEATNFTVVSQIDNSVAIKVPSSMTLEKLSFVVYDLDGRVAATTSLQSGPAGLAHGHIMERLSKGIYLFAIKGGKGILGAGKMVVR